MNFVFVVHERNQMRWIELKDVRTAKFAHPPHPFYPLTFITMGISTLALPAGRAEW